MSNDQWAPYRNPALVKVFGSKIAEIRLDRKVQFMHVCGTHENYICQYGLRSLLPESVRIIAGPGCPVCICPVEDILAAIEIAKLKETILATFGDMMRVPALSTSLDDARSQGADIRVVYSPSDAIQLALQHPSRQVVFFSVGFETTAAPMAAAILSNPPANFSIIPANRVVPPALSALLAIKDLDIAGFLLPGHVCTVMGYEEYLTFPRRYQQAVAVAGFEPVDIISAIYQLMQQIKTGDLRVDNAYKRAVRPEGNRVAKKAIEQVFDRTDGKWRGIGVIKDSALSLRPEWERYDAVKRTGISRVSIANDIEAGCICHLIMTGKADPNKCPSFGDTCTPDSPKGPCMVSHEGTCKSWYQYGKNLRQPLNFKGDQPDEG